MPRHNPLQLEYVILNGAESPKQIRTLAWDRLMRMFLRKSMPSSGIVMAQFTSIFETVRRKLLSKVIQFRPA